jgi:hypothetical protein
MSSVIGQALGLLWKKGRAMEYGKVQRMSLAEFADRGVEGDLGSILSQLNGGTFMECHKLIAEETGIWIEDLVPVFQKLDAALATRPLPDSLR